MDEDEHLTNKAHEQANGDHDDTMKVQNKLAPLNKDHDHDEHKSDDHKAERKLSNKRDNNDKKDDNKKEKKPPIAQLPKLQMSPSALTNYYFSNIYYSQPFGSFIYYTNGFSNFDFCRYVNGVPTCERSVVLPATFTIDSHLNYFDIDYNTCDKE